MVLSRLRERARQPTRQVAEAHRLKSEPCGMPPVDHLPRNTDHSSPSYWYNSDYTFG